MGRAPCCSKVGLLRGPWTAREDALLVKYIQEHGEGHWRILPKKAGLLRCGKSCRLRWMNYLRPDIKRGNITPEEDDLIIRLHSLLGNRWSLIAGRLPGRTDNEIKNYWNTHLSRRVKNSAGTSDHHQNRRREINKINNRKKQQKNDAQDGENAKTKIHLPKAVKASPFSVTRRVSTSVAGAGGTEASLCQFATSVNNKDNLAWVTDSDIHFVRDHDHSSSNNYIPGSDSYIVDGTCEEYQELLKNNDLAQLDSFIDSLLD